MPNYIFYILGGLSVITALLVISFRNPIYSVLSLIATFFLISGQYLLLNAQFLFIVNIIVYAGAIMVLFLFVLMLLNIKNINESTKPVKLKFAVVISAGILLLTLLSAITQSYTLQETTMVSETGLVKNLGKLLFTEYVVPFEVSSILFIAAMVGAVVVGKKDKNLKEGENE
ncbi:MAG: NADH-quinone oxidoreductase subunit J [Bacteroidetes bacterium]|nr:NADH-quinone oxidoreductase subunit J [Bacteroidota bacterium]